MGSHQIEAPDEISRPTEPTDGMTKEQTAAVRARRLGPVLRAKGRLGGRWQRPSVRASAAFQLLRNLFAYTPREEILDFAMHFVQESALEGDYLEFGVFRGHTLAGAFHTAKRYGLDGIHLYAFDSFCGLPPSSGIDSA